MYGFLKYFHSFIQQTGIISLRLVQIGKEKYKQANTFKDRALEYKR